MKITVSAVWASRYGVAAMVGQPAIVRDLGVFTPTGQRLAGALLALELFEAAGHFNRLAELLGRPERMETK